MIGYDGCWKSGYGGNQKLKTFVLMDIQGIVLENERK